MASHPTPSSRSKSAAIYRNAAAYLFLPSPRTDWGCCDAINQIAKGNPLIESEEKTIFENTFKPSGSGRLYWGNEWSNKAEIDNWNTEFDKAVHDCRVLALCFMAAITERP